VTRENRYDHEASYTWQLWSTQAAAWQLFHDRVITAGKWQSDESWPFEIVLEFKAQTRAIFVTHPEKGESIYSDYMAPGHTPDGYEPTTMWFSVNGEGIEYAKLEQVLAVCSPPERVQMVRDLVVQMQRHVDEGKGFFA